MGVEVPRRDSMLRRELIDSVRRRDAGARDHVVVSAMAPVGLTFLSSSLSYPVGVRPEAAFSFTRSMSSVVARSTVRAHYKPPMALNQAPEEPRAIRAIS
jgi:hypothetical protein